jgi:hypothetical protein
MYGWCGSDATLEMLDAGLKTFHNLANAAHLVEFDLKLVDFAEDAVEACDFGVGHLYGVAGAVILYLGGRLCLLRELGIQCQ